MDDKIKETKLAILDRIHKAIIDETKSISPEALEKMSCIVDMFDKTEYNKETIKTGYDKLLNALSEKKEEVKEPEPVIEEGV